MDFVSDGKIKLYQIENKLMNNFMRLVAVDCIALNYRGKHKRKTAIRDIN